MHEISVHFHGQPLDSTLNAKGTILHDQVLFSKDFKADGVRTWNSVEALIIIS